MQSSYFYHSSIRNYIISFMTVFNNIKVRHSVPGSPDYRERTVPVQFLPKEKFVEEYLDNNRNGTPQVEKILPRIAIDLTAMSYDSARKTNTLNKYFQNDGNGSYNSQLNPVPYNFDFSLNIFTRYSDEMLQIVEQILPFFQPSFNITIKEMETMGITERDIPILLTGTDLATQYVGDKKERRRLESSLTFTLKGWLYPDIKTGSNLIKKVIVDFGIIDGQEIETIIHEVDPWSIVDPEEFTLDDIIKKAGIVDTFTGDDGEGMYQVLWQQIAPQVPLPIISNNRGVMPAPTSPPTFTSGVAISYIEAPAPQGFFIEASFYIDDMVDPDYCYLICRSDSFFRNWVHIVQADGGMRTVYVNDVFGPENIMYTWPAGTFTNNDKVAVVIDGYGAATGSPDDTGTLKVYLNNQLLKTLPLSGPVDAGSSPSFPGAPLSGAGAADNDADKKRIGFGLSGPTGAINDIRLGLL